MSTVMHRSLEERLRNWGRERRGVHDPEDARRLDAAWRRLDPRHRELLRLIYVWKAGREVACRRLKIRRHPPHFFELELAAAKVAISRLLEDTR
ncbi:hypothetical protein [Paraburkholderia sp. BCC1885]|uniref:hypothetical protein n=1 Tax=Paraburkholderia sp. BCC1885 TaxID=2562669 RepID=UPI001182E3D9|nr:hypothetical protein [Paraburkholderia sp. BCC1885]